MMTTPTSSRSETAEQPGNAASAVESANATTQGRENGNEPAEQSCALCVTELCMSELKPCPFCSSISVVLRQSHRTYFVDCDDCGARGSVYATEAACAEGWNEAPRAALQQTKPPQERAEKSPDDKHAWEFEPHYDSDFDVLVCPHENAWDELVKVVEAVYDNMEAGEERTITLRFNGEKP